MGWTFPLTIPLTDILNASFSQCIIPGCWKKAQVVPVPKTTQPAINDLRPVSLTDHFAKIAEKFIAKSTLSNKGSSIDPAQFGNRKGISTAHYLIDNP